LRDIEDEYSSEPEGAIMTREEACARELFRELADRFEDSATGTTVTIAGGNILWKVIVTRERRACEVSVFIESALVYIVSLEEGGDLVGTATTADTQEVATVVDAWLHGDAYEFLHDAYPFVELHEKVLAGLLGEAVVLSPELHTTGEHRISRNSWFSFRLVISVGDRECRAFSGSNVSPLPTVSFTADGSDMMSLELTGLARECFPGTIRRWLLDRAMPSDIHREFPLVKLGPLVPYYEEGRLMEGEFIVSWDMVEEGVRRWNALGERAGAHNRDFFCIWERIGRFVALLREAGYDRCLRAGTAVTYFIVSRSRHYGLRAGQPSITFWLPEDRMDVITDNRSTPALSLPRAELTPEVRALLDDLVSKPID